MCKGMSCFICKKDFNIKPGTTSYLRPNQLTSKLQDRKYKTGLPKPDVKILEALEDISDGDVTSELLRKYAAHYICHECQVNLRQAVNKKAELEHYIQLLNERISPVSNKDRRNYYRENYGKDKRGRCWGCMYEFVPADYKKKRSDRMHLATHVVEGMSAGEAINSLLEHEAETLLGLYEKKVFICKKCFQLLRNVIRAQCAFDILQTSFMTQANINSVFAKLVKGEVVPPELQTLDESIYTGRLNEGISGGTAESGETSPTKSQSALYRITASRYDKRPFHKMLGSLPAVPRKSGKNPKRQKVSQEEDSEDRVSDVEFDIDMEGEVKKEMEVNEITEPEDIEKDMEVNELTASDDTETVNKQTRKLLTSNTEPLSDELEKHDEESVKACDNNSDFSGNFTSASFEITDKNNACNVENVKKQIHVKVSLHGTEIKALMDDGSKTGKNEINVLRNEGSRGGKSEVKELMYESRQGQKSEIKAFTDGGNEGEKNEMKEQMDEAGKEGKNEIKTLTDEGGKGTKETVPVDANACPVETELYKQDMSDTWVLYYYPTFSGRAEFIRLIFEETGTPYKECEETFASLRKLIIDGEMEGYPHFAPPMIKKGSFQVSQTPVICRYLGEELGLYPATLEDKLHAEQINQCCHDYIAEGRLAFHGINQVGPYLSQKEETQPYIDRFVSERLPRWLKYFERVLASNNGGKGFLFGEKITYCDLGLFHSLHATESQFPNAYKSADYIPLLKAFKERIIARPRIASYLKSQRWRGFSGDSMM
ncbi:uncharacterized protein LOC123531584 isoform X2 [Mercenaria mercenaria]|uniref:uncharacterized protein LOC123531584 isoform X2 n=1 Tax=Mercenaria mercenaria TaxID=6596 RepID=UPI00234F3F02|nr:uncharacterized protein LOC123531584 isoform X2 [Mercenaria mercenaria]